MASDRSAEAIKRDYGRRSDPKRIDGGYGVNVRLTVQLSGATAVIKRDAVQKLIALWRATDVPVVMVEAEVKDGRAVIRIAVERVMTKIVRDLPCDIEGWKNKSRTAVH